MGVKCGFLLYEEAYAINIRIILYVDRTGLYKVDK